MKKIVFPALKTVMLVLVIVALAVTFCIVFKRGFWSLAIVLSPLVSMSVALLVNDIFIRKKYHLEPEKDSFRYIGEEEYMPYKEFLKREKEADNRYLIMFFSCNIILLAIIALLASL